MPVFNVQSTTRLTLLAIVALASAMLAMRSVTPASAATIAVTSALDNESNGCGVGACTLREAITLANASPATHDLITFNIPGDGPHSIRPQSQLPAITSPVTIDGFCQDCEGASPNTLGIDQPSDAAYAIELNGAEAGVFARGLVAGNGSTVTIRGLVFNGWTGSAVHLANGANHVVAGNMFGVAVDGLSLAPNKYGIEVGSPAGARIGGTLPADRNIISGSEQRGIYAVAGSDLVVAGNFIGLGRDGITAVPNLGGGVTVLNVANAVVGGGTPAHRNVIAGNGKSGSQVPGVAVEIAPGAVIAGNYIGLDRTGAATPGLQAVGVQVFDSTDVTVANNVISGNSQWGIYAISGGGLVENLVIQRNFIGTNAAGTAAIGNGLGGIITYNSSDMLIGGTANGEGNLISGNGSGIQFASNVFGLAIQGNKIGTDVTGALPLGNTFDGIRIYSDPSAAEVLIGGPIPQAGNLIAYNGGRGVFFDSNVANEITLRANLIHSNGALSIELLPGGTNVNDPGDADDGANERQNHPVLVSAVRGNTGMVASATFDTEASQVVKVEFFASDTCGAGGTRPQAKQFLGAFDVQIDDQGLAEDSFVFANLPAGTYITSTMTSALGDTSELSPCIQVQRRPRADVDCNGVVDGLDTLAIMRSLAGYTSGLLPQACQVDPATPDGDADGDGDVDIADVVHARLVASGLG